MKVKSIISLLLFTVLTGLSLSAQTRPHAVNSDLDEAPYKYNFQVVSGGWGYTSVGSASIITSRVVVTAQHVVFDDYRLTWVNSVNLKSDSRSKHFHVSSIWKYSLTGLTGYAGRVEGDQQDSSILVSYETFNRDLALISTRSIISPYNLNIAYSNNSSTHPLTTNVEKSILGFPVEDLYINSSEKGKLHKTNLNTKNFEAYKTGIDFKGHPWGLYILDDVIGVKGNSGGPVTVNDPIMGVVPAGVFVGRNSYKRTIIIRGFDEEVLNLIDAADQAAGGPGYGNFTLPEITTQGAIRDFFPGDHIAFEVVFQIDTKTQLQWYKNGSPLSGTNDFLLEFPDSDTTDAGVYYLKATREGIIRESEDFELILRPAPSIDTEFDDRILIPGTHLSFDPRWENDSETIYQWYHDGDPVDDSSETPYFSFTFEAEDEGEWWQTASNPTGTGTTNHFTLTRSKTFTTIVDSIDAEFDTDFTLTPTINPISNYEVHWYYASNSGVDPTILPGQTNIELSISNIQSSHSGYYQLKITNLDTGSTEYSNKFYINVGDLIVATDFSSQNRTIPVLPGDPISLYSEFIGGYQPIEYQWYFKEELIQGADEHELQISRVVPLSTGDYHVVATDNLDYSARSGTYTVTIEETIEGPHNWDTRPDASPLVDTFEHLSFGKGLATDKVTNHITGWNVIDDLLFTGPIIFPVNPSEGNISTMHVAEGNLTLLEPNGHVVFSPDSSTDQYDRDFTSGVRATSTHKGPIVLNWDRKAVLWDVSTDSTISPPAEIASRELVKIKASGNILWATDTENQLWQWNIDTDEVSQPAGKAPVQDFALRKTNKAVLFKNGDVLQLGYQYILNDGKSEIPTNDQPPDFEFTPLEIDVTDNLTIVRMENNEVKIWGKIPLSEDSILGSEGDLLEVPNYKFLASRVVAGSHSIKFEEYSNTGGNFKQYISGRYVRPEETIAIWTRGRTELESYHWILNNKIIGTTEHPYLVLEDITEEEIGSYRLLNIEQNKAYPNTWVTVSYSNQFPRIYSTPGNQMLPVGYHHISLGIQGDHDHVNWYKDGAFIQQHYGSLSKEFTIEDSGIYQAEVVNNYYRIWSKEFTLTFKKPQLYTDWAATHQINPELEYYSEDNDLDGVPNVMEYILGGNPTSFDTPQIKTEPGHQLTTVFVNYDSTHTPPNNYRIYLNYSTDLENWSNRISPESRNSTASLMFVIPRENTEPFFFKLSVEEE